MNRLLLVPMNRKRKRFSSLLNGSNTTAFLALTCLALLFVLSCSYLWANMLVVSVLNFCAFLLVLTWLETNNARKVAS